jgi:hypothetical protein
LGDSIDERAEAAADFDERSLARSAVCRIVRRGERAAVGYRTVAPAVAAPAATGERI